MIDIEQLLQRLPREAADAVVGMGRLRSSDLNLYLQETLGAQAGRPGSFLSEPFIEGAFPWLPAPGGWDGLDPSLLHPETVRVLRRISPFPPYAHQVEAWGKLAAQEAASVIVSSGTGSGKTECFLTPVLDRLVRLSDGGKRPLTGVRALMLYPLNALISSQEERLARWFEPFAGRLRYCLYNGETPDTPGRIANERLAPWKVGNRTALRADPPPVLVTNITMLEYMLIRHRDEPILSKSRGLLDFIVLDEAHSYIGAQAAELALLLRRVAIAFGTRPEEVRYVATSATIGGEDGSELRRFLCDISGAPEDRVHLVRGARAPLPAAADTSDEPIELPGILEAVPEEAGRVLARSTTLREVRERLRQGRTLSWTGWRAQAAKVAGTGADPVALLVTAAGARDPNAEGLLRSHGADAVLPARIHVFHRTLTGVWACVDPNCPDKPRQAEGDWPFGAVYLERREHCETCRSLVLEWAFCSRCGDGALKAETVDDGTRVAPWDDPSREDGFEQALDHDETYGAEEEDDTAAAAAPPRPDLRYLWPASSRPFPKIVFDVRTGFIADEIGAEGIAFDASRDTTECPHCQFAPDGTVPTKGALRSLAAGAPFLVSQITPAVVGRLSAFPSNEPLPFEGRQLITFTDARQGTARHAANMQVASERGFVRSFLYHFAQERPPRDEAQIAELDRKIRKFEASDDPDHAEMIERWRAQRIEAEGGASAKTWPDLVGRLANDATVAHFLQDVWSVRDETFADGRRLAELMLYREIMRRPVRANSAETLGLVRLLVPRVDGPEATLPGAAAHLGLTLDDWRDLVRLLLTHFIRTNVILDFDARRWMRWIDRRQAQITMVRRREPHVPASPYVRVWPNPYGKRLTRVVRLVSQVLCLDLGDRSTQDRLDAVLDAAWNALLPYATPTSEGYRFRLSELHLAPVEKAWWCPTTRRIVDTTFRGVSPYDRDGVHPPAQPIELPLLPCPWGKTASGIQASQSDLEQWLETDERIGRLRRIGAWGDQQDRAARFARWLRAAEHSAQQPSSTLRAYEAEFKRGAINVMACSTTMEMGVDIGSIEAVLNTNAPPAIANYRQRVGRAGRARQPLALALTICKDRPLDRLAFAEPAAFLAKEVPAPRVSLESPTIAHRHANAYLLAAFLKVQGSQLHKLTNGRFFGIGLPPEAAGTIGFPYSRFLAWLDANAADAPLGEDLRTILEGTPVRVGPDLFERLRERIEGVRDDLVAEWDALSDGAEGAAEDAAGRAREYQRRRLEQNYLLGELAGRGVLPSYGFPTDVVPFVIESADERQRRMSAEDTDEDSNRFKARGWPSRQRDVAISEYAPGRGIVIDGVVRESAGVTLNWKRPADQDGVREVQSLRRVAWCRSCGTLSSAPASVVPDLCPACGSSEEPKSSRFLAPAGFAVDIRSHRHDDTRNLGTSLPVDPWVSARNAIWRALPDPLVGRVRSGPDGLVFWFNPGPYGHGFEVCLHCGRAAPEEGANAPSKLVDHRPLRGVPLANGGPRCTGGIVADAPFAIARHLHLGQEIRTDVCEVQLYDCDRRETAMTVALALREAAARRLGIDTDEMGYGAPEAPHPSFGRSYAAVVFDRASGGAGFSATIARDPVGMLAEARDLLDCCGAGRCGDPDARNACPRCVLSSDSQHVAEDTDRKAAFELLGRLMRRLDLPREARLFGDATVYEAAPLGEALSERLVHDGAAQLIVPLAGEPSSWDLETWPMTSVLERWGARGRTCLVLVDPSTLDAADAVTRRQVVMWSQRARVDLRSVPAREMPSWLAAVNGHNGTTAWTTLAVEAREIGGKWAAASDAPIVRGAISSVPKGGDLDVDQLLAAGAGGREALVEIAGQLDGPVKGFGVRLRSLLVAHSPELRRALSAPLLSLRYSDRYLFSPLAVRLLGELVSGFADAQTTVTITTLRSRTGSEPRPGRWIFTDWPNLETRLRVMRQVLADIAPNVTVETPARIAHRRRLDFVTEKGSGTIFFDQGLGSWSAANRVAFDHAVSVEAQLQALGQPFEVVNGPEGTFLAARLAS